MAGSGMQYLVAFDGAVLAIRAPVAHKASIGIGGCRILLGMLLPAGIVIPNAKGLRKVLFLNCCEELIHPALRPHVPRQKSGDSNHPGDTKQGNDESAPLPAGSCVVNTCVH